MTNTLPEAAVLTAALAYAEATTAMHSHEGPYQGKEFAAKCATWRAAQFDLIEAAKRMPTPTKGETENG